LRLAITRRPVETIVVNVSFMIPRRVYLVGFAAFFALTGPHLTAAGPAYSMELFNNTERAIEFVQGRKGSAWVTIIPGRSKYVPYSDGVTIKVDERLLHFKRVDPPPDYARKGLFSTSLKAQLNSDLKIWLLRPAASWEAFKMPAQPEGFPLSSSR
jgi:hypothetical protein